MDDYVTKISYAQALSLVCTKFAEAMVYACPFHFKGNRLFIYICSCTLTYQRTDAHAHVDW